MVLQAESLCQLPGPLHTLPSGDAAQRQRQSDIVLQAHGIQKAVVLKHKPDLIPPELRQLLIGSMGNIPPVQHHRALGRFVYSRKNIQQGSLTRPGRPHDGRKILPVNSQFQPLKHPGLKPSAAINLHQILHLRCPDPLRPFTPFLHITPPQLSFPLH